LQIFENHIETILGKANWLMVDVYGPPIEQTLSSVENPFAPHYVISY